MNLNNVSGQPLFANNNSPASNNAAPSYESISQLVGQLQTLLEKNFGPLSNTSDNNSTFNGLLIGGGEGRSPNGQNAYRIDGQPIASAAPAQTSPQAATPGAPKPEATTSTQPAPEAHKPVGQPVPSAEQSKPEAHKPTEEHKPATKAAPSAEHSTPETPAPASEHKPAEEAAPPEQEKSKPEAHKPAKEHQPEKPLDQSKPEPIKQEDADRALKELQDKTKDLQKRIGESGLSDSAGVFSDSDKKEWGKKLDGFAQDPSTRNYDSLTKFAKEHGMNVQQVADLQDLGAPVKTYNNYLNNQRDPNTQLELSNGTDRHEFDMAIDIINKRANEFKETAKDPNCKQDGPKDAGWLEKVDAFQKDPSTEKHKELLKYLEQHQERFPVDYIAKVKDMDHAAQAVDKYNKI